MHSRLSPAGVKRRATRALDDFVSARERQRQEEESIAPHLPASFFKLTEAALEFERPPSPPSDDDIISTSLDFGANKKTSQHHNCDCNDEDDDGAVSEPVPAAAATVVSTELEQLEANVAPDQEQLIPRPPSSRPQQQQQQQRMIMTPEERVRKIEAEDGPLTLGNVIFPGISADGLSVTRHPKVNPTDDVVKDCLVSVVEDITYPSVGTTVLMKQFAQEDFAPRLVVALFWAGVLRVQASEKFFEDAVESSNDNKCGGGGGGGGGDGTTDDAMKLLNNNNNKNNAKRNNAPATAADQLRQQSRQHRSNFERNRQILQRQMNNAFHVAAMNYGHFFVHHHTHKVSPIGATGNKRPPSLDFFVDALPLYLSRTSYYMLTKTFGKPKDRFMFDVMFREQYCGLIARWCGLADIQDLRRIDAKHWRADESAVLSEPTLTSFKQDAMERRLNAIDQRFSEISEFVQSAQQAAQQQQQHGGDHVNVRFRIPEKPTGGGGGSGGAYTASFASAASDVAANHHSFATSGGGGGSSFGSNPHFHQQQQRRRHSSVISSHSGGSRRRSSSPFAIGNRRPGASSQQRPTSSASSSSRVAAGRSARGVQNNNNNRGGGANLSPTAVQHSRSASPAGVGGGGGGGATAVGTMLSDTASSMGGRAPTTAATTHQQVRQAGVRFAPHRIDSCLWYEVGFGQGIRGKLTRERRIEKYERHYKLEGVQDRGLTEEQQQEQHQQQIQTSSSTSANGRRHSSSTALLRDLDVACGVDEKEEQDDEGVVGNDDDHDGNNNNNNDDGGTRFSLLANSPFMVEFIAAVGIAPAASVFQHCTSRTHPSRSFNKLTRLSTFDRHGLAASFSPEAAQALAMAANVVEMGAADEVDIEERNRRDTVLTLRIKRTAEARTNAASAALAWMYSRHNPKTAHLFEQAAGEVRAALNLAISAQRDGSSEQTTEDKRSKKQSGDGDGDDKKASSSEGGGGGGGLTARHLTAIKKCHSVTARADKHEAHLPHVFRVQLRELIQKCKLLLKQMERQHAFSAAEMSLSNAREQLSLPEVASLALNDLYDMAVGKERMDLPEPAQLLTVVLDEIAQQESKAVAAAGNITGGMSDVMFRGLSDKQEARMRRLIEKRRQNEIAAAKERRRNKISFISDEAADALHLSYGASDSEDAQQILSEVAEGDDIGDGHVIERSKLSAETVKLMEEQRSSGATAKNSFRRIINVIRFADSAAASSSSAAATSSQLMIQTATMSTTTGSAPDAGSSGSGGGVGAGSVVDDNNNSLTANYHHDDDYHTHHATAEKDDSAAAPSNNNKGSHFDDKQYECHRIQLSTARRLSTLSINSSSSNLPTPTNATSPARRRKSSCSIVVEGDAGNDDGQQKGSAGASPPIPPPLPPLVIPSSQCNATTSDGAAGRGDDDGVPTTTASRRGRSAAATSVSGRGDNDNGSSFASVASRVSSGAAPALRLPSALLKRHSTAVTFNFAEGGSMLTTTDKEDSSWFSNDPRPSPPPITARTKAKLSASGFKPACDKHVKM